MKKPLIMMFIFVLGLAVGSLYHPSSAKPELKGQTNGSVLISRPVEGGHKIERLRLIPKCDDFGGNEWWIEINDQVYIAVPMIDGLRFLPPRCFQRIQCPTDRSDPPGFG